MAMSHPNQKKTTIVYNLCISSKMKSSSTKGLFCESPSSSSDEEDACGRGVPPHKVVAIQCKNVRCEKEFLCVNNSEYYCSRDCYYSKLERDKIGETGIRLKRITINGRGGTGLLRDRSLLDHLVIRVDNVLGRTVTVRNVGVNASRWKRHSGKKEKMSSEKQTATDEAKNKRKEEEKRRLKELLGGGGGSSSSEESTNTDDDDDKTENKAVAEGAIEEIQTIQSSGINSNICPVHVPVGKRGSRFKGYIINIVNPWELYIQTEDMVLKTNQIDEICNRPEGIDPRLVLPLWLPQVGGYCAAKYEDKLYRAKILNKVESKFRVKYMDYGNVGLIPHSDVMQLNPELTLIPRQYFLLKISNVKPLNSDTRWTPEICQFLMEHLDGGIAEVEVESVERGVVHWGKINVISSLSGEIQGDVGNILVQRKMADPDSFYL